MVEEWRENKIMGDGGSISLLTWMVDEWKGEQRV
jgi:hypothetical protein